MKEFSVVCMGRFKPLGSLNSFLSSVPQLSGPNPVSLFTYSSGSCGRYCSLCSPSSSAVTVAVAASAGLSFGNPHSHLEARNRWWLWHFLFIGLAVELFISLYLLISNTLCYSMPILPQFLATTILFFTLWDWLFSIRHIRGFVLYLSICFWLIFLGIMSSRLVHIVSYDRISFFLRRNNNPLYVYTTVYLSTHLLMDI